MFDQITCYAPQNRKFIGNATMPLPHGITFVRNACPFNVKRGANILPTFWELVARYPNGEASVIELFWEDEGVTTEKVVYDVVDRIGPGADPTTHMSTLAMNALSNTGQISLELTEQDGSISVASISAPVNQWKLTKISPLCIKGERHINLACGISAHVFAHIKSDRPHIYLDLNMHSGNYAINPPHVYLTTLKLKLLGGGGFTKIIPDGQTTGTDDLITPGQHFWPQTQQREFRLILHPPGVNPNEEMLGLGFAHGWHRSDRAGYLAQGIQAPKMDWSPGLLTAIKRLKGERFNRLINRLPGNPDYNTGTLGFWPVTGVSYGGMTSGVDIEQIPGADTLGAKHPDGILVHMAESLRYGVRQPGQIYEMDGSPVKVELHADTAGNIPWRHFNYVFSAKRPFEITDPRDTHWDTPFNLDIARTRTKPGTCAYETQLKAFEPIDYQHTTRATKDYRVLAWLANDSIAKLRLQALAENARLTFWEKGNGQLDDNVAFTKAQPHYGSNIGRAEAWVMDAAAHSYALSNNNWRTRWQSWWDKFGEYIFYSQTPSGLFQGAGPFGKQATDQPNGHAFESVCPFGFHPHQPGNISQIGDFMVGICNEHFFLMNTLKAILAYIPVQAVNLTGVLEKAARCTYDYIWKQGGSGPWFRYMCRFINQAPFANRQALIDAVAVVPDFWTRLDSRLNPPQPFLYVDGYHVPSSIGYGMATGAHGDDPLNSYMNEPDAATSFEEIKEYYNDEVQKVVDATPQNLSFALQDFKYAGLESRAFLMAQLETRFPG